MAALPYMQFYVADYLADTAHLTTEEHGAYLLLLFSYWQTGKPLRADRLASVARVSNDRWDSVETTLREFFHVDGNSWVHFRVEADLDAVNSKAKQASDAGKASARARAAAKEARDRASGNDRSTPVDDPLQRNGNHIDTDTDTDKNQKPLSSGDDVPVKKDRSPSDPIPYAKVLEIYQATCAGVFLGAEKLTAGRKTAIARAWRFKARGKVPFQDLEFWQKYFERCKTNRHWCGENDRNWKADLEFVLREANIVKVLGV